MKTEIGLIPEIVEKCNVFIIQNGLPKIREVRLQLY